jgi:hypothetical protein
VILIAVVGPLVLHFGQKRHDVLDFNVAAQFPGDRPIVPGEVFATTLSAVIDHELNGVTGWRPNDFILWGPKLWADNNANRQLGIIQAVRDTMRVFKDHLTKVSSDEFDRNLVAADTAFRNDSERLWLPSAESKFREGVANLRAYVEGLKATPPRSKPINQRNIELIRLFQTWGDLLGDAHGALYRSDVTPWTTDDYFYHAQGFAHVVHYMVQAIAREYAHMEETKPIVGQLMSEVADALGKAAQLKPLIVLDGAPDGLFANHRRNLDSYINEARQKIYSIREELEK